MPAAIQKKAPAPAQSPNLPPTVYRQAVDQADLAVSITDPKANILFANEAFSRVTGYSAEEVVGKNESILSNHSTPRVVYEGMWAHLTAGKPWSGRLLNRRKDGSVYLAEIGITPVQDAEGRITNYLGMHRDVTDLHRLECQVNNQRRLTESVIDAAPVVFALLDINGRVMLDNQEYKKLVTDLGVPEPAHVLLDTLCPGWRQQMVIKPATCEFAGREARVDRPQGMPRWFSCSASLIRMNDESADGFFCSANITGLLLAVSDITSLRQEQEKARTSALHALLAEEERVASIRESLSAAIFRLEEPMNVMASAVNVLQRRDPGSTAILKEALAASREHIESLRQAIPQRGPELLTGVNLNEILRDALDVTTRRLLSAGILVDWQPAATLPRITGRPIQLRVLFKALVENAVEAMDVKGWQRRELRIATTVEHGCIVVRIADSGPGIPPEWRLQVFEPFFTTKNGSGKHLGTGLSRAYQVAADHGGIIDLEDTPRGGCTAVLEFPIDGDPL
jgi:nitrogen fixation negative regulator NifL